MKKYFSLFLVISSLTVAEEVSVYGDSNSYNLNSTEKHILKTQANVSNLSSKLDEISTLVNSINSRLSGLESTYEGDSARLNSKFNELQNNVQSSDLASNNVTETAQSDLNTLKASITKLTNLVNKINSEYISSSELQKNMQQFVTREEFEAVKKAMGIKTSSIAPTTNTIKTNSSTTNFGELKTAEDRAKLMAEAKKNYENKVYNEAIPKYEKLVELNYKPAENNFYLAEMWYKRKNYDTAISHFKKSAMLNDKAAYMPTLLLHSAIAFENVKDKDNAKSFYSTLIDLYPNSSEAKEAKTKLSKL